MRTFITHSLNAYFRALELNGRGVLTRPEHSLTAALDTVAAIKMVNNSLGRTLECFTETRDVAFAQQLRSEIVQAGCAGGVDVDTFGEVCFYPVVDVIGHDETYGPSLSTGIWAATGIWPLTNAHNLIKDPVSLSELLVNPDSILDIIFCDGFSADTTDEINAVKACPYFRTYWAFSIVLEKYAMYKALNGWDVPSLSIGHFDQGQYNAWDKQGLLVDAILSWTGLEGAKLATLTNTVKSCFEYCEVQPI